MSAESATGSVVSQRVALPAAVLGRRSFVTDCANFAEITPPQRTIRFKRCAVCQIICSLQSGHPFRTLIRPRPSQWRCPTADQCEARSRKLRLLASVFGNQQKSFQRPMLPVAGEKVRPISAVRASAFRPRLKFHSATRPHRTENQKSFPPPCARVQSLGQLELRLLVRGNSASHSWPLGLRRQSQPFSRILHRGRNHQAQRLRGPG